MKHNIVYEEGMPVSVTVYRRGKFYVATSDHPNFSAIITALTEGRPAREVVDLFDPGTAIKKGFRLASRLIKAALAPAGSEEAKEEEAQLVEIANDLGVRNGVLHFQGEPMHGALAETVLALYEQDNQDAFVPFVKFLRKVMSNPNEHSREHLYEWMKHLSFNITEEGNILAYKGVKRNSEHGFASVTAGPAICAGKYHHSGPVPNVVGTTVEMAREQVTFDPAIGCAAGLHVGTMDYASRFGTVMIEVIVDPRDVVSVPTDCGWQKMRVCKYYVKQEVTSPVRLLNSNQEVAI